MNRLLFGRFKQIKIDKVTRIKKCSNYHLSNQGNTSVEDINKIK